ncbi:hypothetical protein [Palaeococcus ferrophilus]|uniref:hypothetical protein n=1 Tax=Palaeococcus ferrophilus TaxID=83868 RepID=UPI00064FDE7A|nr:hypothetical protein [Palaeococcus ferrophilus]
MMEFVVLAGIVGGWLVMTSTLFLMLAFGRDWGILGVFLLVAVIEINKWLKNRYLGSFRGATTREEDLALHMFEMNELIAMSSYATSLFLYYVIQKYIEITVVFPGRQGF